MKCPFRVNIKTFFPNQKETITTQNFAECYGVNCPYAIITEYWIGGIYMTKIDGCRKIKDN